MVKKYLKKFSGNDKIKTIWYLLRFLFIREMTQELYYELLEMIEGCEGFEFYKYWVEPYEGDVRLTETIEQIENKLRKKVLYFADDGKKSRWFYDAELKVVGEAIYGGHPEIIPKTIGVFYKRV